MEVVWHLQHPRRYEVQTSLDGAVWVSRAVQVIGAEDDATPTLSVRSPLSPSASWEGVTARHVRVWMVSPAAARQHGQTRRPGSSRADDPQLKAPSCLRMAAL